MRKLSIFITLASLSLASCTSPPPIEKILPSPLVSSSPTPSPLAASPVVQSPPPIIQTVPITGLVPSVDPDLRRTIVARGKTDPFTIFPIQAKTEYSQRHDITSTVKKPPKVASKTFLKTKDTQVQHLEPKAIPNPPSLAQSTLITGIVNMGGDNILIVLRSPAEDTSRYVKVGQYIAGGQVLIKRVINANTNSPTVILEEKGQEFYKRIGQGGPISQNNEPNLSKRNFLS